MLNLNIKKMNQIKNRFTGKVIFEYDANLREANLREANLHEANLHGAYLREANLHAANLHGANLRGADLSGANLYGADLHGANLREADLSGANLRDFFNIPEEGSFVGYKKLRNNIIAKVQIPAKAKRTSSLVGRKNRAEYVKVLSLSGGVLKTSSIYDNAIEYVVGEVVRPDSYNDDIRVECTNGIHFFTTRKEAENN